MSHTLAHIHMHVFGAEKGVCKYVVDVTVLACWHHTRKMPMHEY